MKYLGTALALVPAVIAFPAGFNPSATRTVNSYQKRADNATQAISQAQSNCGPHLCTTFDEQAQFVSNTGEHAYQSPAPDDIRGPCPGLNAAANHGYLPRNGIATIPETILGLGDCFGKL